jgi:Tol biopolymer transport system component
LRHKVILIGLIIPVIMFYSFAEQKNFPILKGPYLGQKPPGIIPQIFAPGIISTDISEGCSGWGNNMEYFVFQRWIDRKPKLYIMNQVDGRWSEPVLLSFAEKFQIGDFTIAPDGKTLVFASRIFLDEIGGGGEGCNIWMVKKTGVGWSKPAPLGMEINTKYHESYPCLANNGNLYFFSRRPAGYGDSDLYISKVKNGKYQIPTNLGAKLNTQYHEWDTYVAPNEGYMIYCSTKPGGLGSDDLYVTFKQMDGSWSKPVHMGKEINSQKSENRPYISPDGKYLFYASTKSGNRDIYWVDAKILDSLKPKNLK